MKYTFAFSGEITVEANSEAEAFELADDLVAPTAYAFDNCESITVDDISLLEAEDEE